jgi:uncharacterized protein YutE (UPF0331/DUF86 family)
LALDVVLGKVESIERCIRRIREELGDDECNLREDITRQDAILLNLQQACETSIDLAMHLVRVHRLGAPKESRDAFRLLLEAGHLDRELGERLMRMVGFRNIAVHNYRDLDLDIVHSIVTERLGDFLEFARIALQLAE